MDASIDPPEIEGNVALADKPDNPVEVKTKIRYRHEPVSSTMYPTGDHSAIIRFSRPQPAVTPGQGAVCYRDDRVIAGGWIDDE